MSGKRSKMKRNRSFSDEELEENEKEMKTKVENILKEIGDVKKETKNAINSYIKVISRQSKANRDLFLDEEIYALIFSDEEIKEHEKEMESKVEDILKEASNVTKQTRDIINSYIKINSRQSKAKRDLFLNKKIYTLLY